MQEYIYREHLRNPKRFLLGAGGFVISLVLYFALIVLTGTSGATKSRLLAICGVAAIGMLVIISIEIVILYFLVFRKFKDINILLSEEAIIYNNIKGRQIIKYEDIESIKFPSIKYSGGWVKIKYKGGNVRLTVVLEGIGHFVKELKDILDSLDMKDVYTEKKLYSFYKTATYADQSWERLYEKFSKILVWEGIAAVVGILASLLATNFSDKTSIATAIIIYPLIAFTASEVVLGFKISRLAKLEGYEINDRDIEKENKIYRNVYIVIGIITAITLVLTI